MNNGQNLPPYFITRHFKLLFFSLFIIGLLFAILYSSQQIVTGNQEQMLDKGYLGANQGIWLSYGNAASTVGNVPGSLSAYIIGIPLKLWFSPWAPMVFLILLHICSFILFDAVIKKIFNPQIRLVFMLLYWFNPWFLFENSLYNPSYLFFFTALHFWTAFHLRQKQSFVYSFLHLLAIGMAMQLHYSWPILVIISSFLFFRGIIKIQWLGILTATLVIFISLIPYFQELQVNHVISQNIKSNDRYIGWGGLHIYPVLKALLYWLRYASFLFTDKLTLGATFSWLSTNPLVQAIAMYSWRALLYVIGGLTLLFTLRVNYAAWIKIKAIILRKSNNTELSLDNWLLLYVVGTLIAILISASLSPIIFSHWHLIIIFPIALFPILSYTNDWLNNQSKTLSKYLLPVVFYFLIVNLIAANDSKKFSYTVSYSQQAIDYIQDVNLLNK